MLTNCSCTGSGSGVYYPRMVTVLLSNSYAMGRVSSRKIDMPTYESVPMQYVAANQHPDHDTICSFRRRFWKPLDALFPYRLIGTGCDRAGRSTEKEGVERQLKTPEGKAF